MPRYLFLRLCILFFYAYGFGLTQSFFPETELFALQDLYYQTNGPSWDFWRKGMPWNFTELNPNPCAEYWQGIICDGNCTSAECHVVSLGVSAFLLRGTVPESIGNLSKLTELNVGANYLSGTLPTSIGYILSLKSFYAYYNHFEGGIPQSFENLRNLEIIDISNNEFNSSLSVLQSCSSLTDIELDNNFFRGPLPIFFFTKLIHLETISIFSNYFTSSIPPEIGNLKNLTNLLFDENELTGSIPMKIAECTKLSMLSLGTNYLHGTLPDTITTLQYLRLLKLSSNHFSGSLPADFGAYYTQLENIYLGDNLFTGTLSDTIGNMRSLDTINVEHNAFRGKIPSTLGNLHNLFFLFLRQNHFTGSLPTTLNHLINVEYFQIEQNYFTGNLFDCVQNGNTLNTFCLRTLQNITIFHLQENFFHGNNGIVGQILSDYNLIDLNISYNLFSGSIGTVVNTLNFVSITPDDAYPLVTMSKTIFYNLSFFDISNNYFTQSIPTTFFQSFPAVVAINVANNKFRGSLESVFRVNRILTTLDISQNAFTGSIPIEPFRSKELLSFSAMVNCLTGSIPASVICSHKKLQNLILDGLHTAEECQDRFFPYLSTVTSYRLKDHITGTLPTCLFNISTLEALHVSGNFITGSISSNIVISKTLTDLTLSYNQFTGDIPTPIQLKNNWVNLDLSFNKFKGVLDINFAAPKDNAHYALKLKDNWLSGDIPGSLLTASNLEILQGNLFNCEQTETISLDSSAHLPSHDQYSSTYDCGSDSVNTAIYVWIALAITVLLCFYIIFVRAEQFPALLKAYEIMPPNERYLVFSVINKWRSAVNYLRIRVHQWYSIYSHESAIELLTGGMCNEEERRTFKTIYIFGKNMEDIRKLLLVIVGFNLCCLLPCYSILSIYYSTHKYSYAWRVSLAYLAGTTPAVVMLVILLTFYLLCWLFRGQNSVSSTDAGNKISLIDNLKNQLVAVANINSMIQYCDCFRWCKSLSNRIFWAYVGAFLFDGVIVLIVNVAYVYLTLVNVSTDLEYLAAFCFSVFKIIWGHFVVLGFIAEFLRRQQSKNAEAVSDNATERAYSEESLSNVHRPHGGNVWFLVWLVVFNNIIAPFVAEAFVDPNCFYYAIQSQATVDVSYQQYYCSQYVTAIFSPQLKLVICAKYDSISVSTNYTPPFVYSFQCSSSLLNGFIIVFLYRYIVTGLILPVGKILWNYFDGRHNIKAKFLTWCKDFSQKYCILKFVLEEEEIFYFHQEKFVVNLIGDIAVLVTFGFAFPPLAIVITYSMFINTYYYQLYVSSVLLNYCNEKRLVPRSIHSPIQAEDSINVNFHDEEERIPKIDTAQQSHQANDLLLILHRNCGNIRDDTGMIHQFVTPNTSTLAMLSGGFLGLFLFDVLGGQVGAVDASWVAVMSFGLPLMMYAYDKYFVVQ